MKIEILLFTITLVMLITIVFQIIDHLRRSNMKSELEEQDRDLNDFIQEQNQNDLSKVRLEKERQEHNKKVLRTYGIKRQKFDLGKALKKNKRTKLTIVKSEDD